MLTSVAASNKRPRLISSDLGNVHLADLLRESSPQQPQSTTSVDDPIPDSSTSLSGESNPLLKRLLMENEHAEQVHVNSSRTNEAEPVQKECTKNSLLKVLNQILIVNLWAKINELLQRLDFLLSFHLMNRFHLSDGSTTEDFLVWLLTLVLTFVLH